MKKLKAICVLWCVMLLTLNLHAQESIPENLDMTKFKFKDAEGKDVNLSEFKGKYIYLDVWASWCRPCINEFPSFDSLKVEFKDKKIVFLQLSCDQSEMRWRNEMGFTKRKADHFQWFVNGDPAFMKELMVATIPRYLLIDKKGKLIKSHMTRASDRETKTVLAKLKGA